LRLSPGSPCIDAGLGDDFVTVPEFDILGNARVDDLSVTDAGTGTPTYVDMGAYESGGVPAFAVTSPNGGESLAHDTSQAITWTAPATVANIAIELSRDGNWTDDDGSDVEMIVASTDATAGSYAWTPGLPASATCLVRITDVANATTVDVSDAVFEITDAVAPTCAILYPVDGEIDVNLIPGITVEFDEPIDGTTLVVDAGFVLSSATVTSVPGTITWSDGDTTLTFVPSQALEDDRVYTVTIAATVEDVSGNPLGADVTCTFTTRVSTGGLIGEGGGCAPGGGTHVALWLVLFAAAMCRRRASSMDGAAG